MKNSNSISILYIGNKMQEHGKSPTSIDTLSPLFSEFMEVKTASNKKKIIFRFIDIIYTIFKYRNNIDLILVDTYSSKNFYVTLLVSFLAQILKIDYFPFLHGGNLPSRLEKNPKLSNFIFSNSKVNIAPSEYLGNSFIEKGYKVIFIPNNIDLSIYPFKERKVIAPKLLYVRAFETTYNPVMAVKVLFNLLKTYPSAELCMVGPDKDGSLDLVKNEASKLNILDKVKITGRLSKDKWIDLSKEYDIFINTTNADNQPVSIIEAMALGFPIVSTNVGGLPFLIENEINGILVSKNDINKMTSEILNILSNTQLSNNLSKNARKKAEKFDWKNIKIEWKRLFNEYT